MLDRHRPSTPKASRLPSPAAARMRRHRQREQNGVVVVTLAVTPEQTAKLAALHYLGVEELENRLRIAAAIAAALDGIIA